MTEEINGRVERHDIAIVKETTETREALDSHRQTMAEIKRYLKRELKAGELNDPRHEHSGALRRHANLDAVPEHEFTRKLRELREARGE
jgi:hypothetical protein